MREGRANLANLEAHVQVVQTFGMVPVVTVNRFLDDTPEQIAVVKAWRDERGYGELPICMAKTSASLSDDPKKLNAPKGFDVTVQQVPLSVGFLVVLLGHVVRVPGLPSGP